MSWHFINYKVCLNSWSHLILAVTETSIILSSPLYKCINLFSKPAWGTGHVWGPVLGNETLHSEIK